MRSSFLVSIVVVWLAGCSRPATVEECEFIVQRVAELRLRGGLDSSAQIKENAQALTRELEQEIRKECVGKPITERSLACVRRAEKPRQVIECFH